MSFAIALGVHAGLLATLSTCVLRAGEPMHVIMVSLIAGGSGGSGTQPATAPAAQSAAASSQPQAQPKAAHPRRQRPSKSGAAAVALAPRPGAESQPASAMDASGSAERGAGGASGASSGAGDEPGGTGSGAGSGSGDGTGPGDQRAHCVVCPEPIYPLVARRLGWQGTVEVGVSLLADGSVAAADVRRSCGYEILDREAVAVARRSRFTALGAGPVEGHIAYRFQLIAPRP